jgi:hypothetical protein
MRMTKPLAVLLLIVCVALTCFAVACTQAQVDTAVSKIANYIPAVKALVSVAGGLTDAIDPAAAIVVTPVVAVVTNGLTQMQTVCTTYTAANAPSSTKVSAWQAIIQISDTMVQSTDAALLQAVAIKDTGSQAKAVAAIGGIDAALHIIDGWVSQAQPAAAVQTKTTARNIKLKDVAPYWDAADRLEVAHKMGASFNTVYTEATAAGF